MEDTIHVLLIEDNRSYGRVVQRALSDDATIRAVTHIGTSEMALRRIGNRGDISPDIILLDLSLPGIGGLEAIPLLLELVRDAKIIILTQSDREEDVMKAISAGAVGYILKESTPRQIKEAIQSVVAGGACLHPKVSKHVFDAFRDQPVETAIKKALSGKELVTLKLMAKGLARKEIAEELDVSITTVVTHINRIFAKLGVKNAPAAVSKAYRAGILK